ncbi:hypothetical protein [Streptomyces sp. NPDC046727]|uniref:hypothetical protein n=1 Tax=Streptomyces sp. NPDC046727 TaxID=3155373 RepID=UPI0033FC6B34
MAPHCNGAELHELGAVTLHLSAAVLAARLGALSAPTRKQLLLAWINAFISRNLSDPDLGPATIAAHHHIAVRQLHLMFQEQPQTVSTTIRRRRLERVRADLADSQLLHHTIGDIALRWTSAPSATPRCGEQIGGV